MRRYHKNKLSGSSINNEINRPGELTSHDQSYFKVNSNSSIFFPLKNSANVLFKANLFEGFCLFSFKAILLVTHLQNDGSFFDFLIIILVFVLLVYFDVKATSFIFSTDASLN